MFEPAKPIPVQPPKVSLSTAATRLSDGVTWRSGVGARRSQLPTSSRWRQCPDGGDVKLEADNGGGPAQFLPFVIYVTTLCDSSTALSEDEQVKLTLDQLEAVTPWHLARELWTGEFGTAGQENPTLQAPDPGLADPFPPANVVAAAGAAIAPIEALGALYAAYEEATRHGGGALMHVPSVLIPYLMAHRVIVQQGNVFVGPNFVVSGGPGYPTTPGPWGPKTALAPDGQLAAAGEAWIYVTGPVETETGPGEIKNPGMSGHYNRRMNRFEQYAERVAIYRFDPGPVFAAAVTIPIGE